MSETQDARPAAITDEQRVEIYALLDPDTLEVRYIGKAKCALKRYASHLREARRLKRPVNCWVKSLLDRNAAPEARIILTCAESEWMDAERAEISKARASGSQLLNLADGGDHISATVAQRQKCAATATRKRAQTPEAKRLWELRRYMATYARRGYMPQRQKERCWSRPDVFGFLFHIIGPPPASLLTE